MKSLFVVWILLTSSISYSADLLDDISFRSFRYFVENAHPTTGLVRDRAPNDGSKPRLNRLHVGNIAATGFALTAYCIGAERGWISRSAARQQVLKTLRFLSRTKNRVHGWYYHWVDVRSGERIWNSEVSSIDTSFLLAGVLTVRNCFSDSSEVVSLATTIYKSVDFKWMLNGHSTLLSHGWVPKKGFLPYRWDEYSEHLLLYLLAIGSPTHAISPASWYAFVRDVVTRKNITYVQSLAPLFVHQYSHAWIDFRNLKEESGFNWFQNSVNAVLVHRDYCLDLSAEFPSYSADMWGLTASDSVHGYVDWGGLKRHPLTDGTLVPSALSGSIMFVGNVAEEPLRKMYEQYGTLIYGRYGFANAFNPLTGWMASDVIGIDVGITLLSIENFKSDSVWKWLSQDLDIRRAIKRVGMSAAN